MAKKNSSQQDLDRDPVTHFLFFKKFKRLNPLDYALSYFGLVILVVFFMGCFSYFDYRAITGRLFFPRLNGPVSILDPNRWPEFLGDGGDGCDVFDGFWVWDEAYPLYQSRDCLFLDEGFRCNENGRPDSLYTKWRWQPKYCNLPRFDARNMLEKLRNRRVVFVGDSIGRNQWESFLCMLSSAVHNKTSIYEVEGRPITKHTGSLVFKFKDFNCTVEYYRAPFLVLQSRAPSGAPEGVTMTVKVDQMDWSWKQWKDADVVVLNTGHWWNYEKTIRGGCYFQEREEVKMNISVESAYKRSLETVVNWIGSQVDTSRTHVFFRTYAPVHFRGGDWKTGGSCHREKLPDLSMSPILSDMHYQIAIDVFDHLKASEIIKLDLLNVTNMSYRRMDGHASLYYLGPEHGGPVPLHRQDCSHWCLPGVPDSWNVLLYALFMKRESIDKRNSTKPSQTSQIRQNPGFSNSAERTT